MFWRTSLYAYFPGIYTHLFSGKIRSEFWFKRRKVEKCQGRWVQLCSFGGKPLKKHNHKSFRWAFILVFFSRMQVYTMCIYIYIMCVYVFAILLYHLQGCYCLRHSHSTTIIVHLWQIPGCDILADLVDGLCFWGAIWQDLGATCPTIAYPKSVFDSGWGWLGITPKKKGRSVSKMKRHRMDKRAARTRSPKFGASWKKSLALRRPRVPMPQVKHSWAAR